MAGTSSGTLFLFLFIIYSFLISWSSTTHAQPLPNPRLFPNFRQYQAYLVIQRFKLTITCDPRNITRTWVGFRPCRYKGFYCESPPDSPNTPTIASIDFNGFRLCAPTLVGFVDQLPDLALFHANSNNFSGPIPNLAGLRYLYELDFSNHIHPGPFPTTLLPLVNLTFLDIRFNRFVGVVPPAIFLLPLEVLFLNNNFFNQSLPATLGMTPANYLTLANNRFTGPIPPSIGAAAKTLIEVLFLNNKLWGCLPFQIGLLRRATVFDTGSNLITGPIPWSLGCLRKVEQLNLANNLLYGEVPDVVCRLAVAGNLANLSLSGNYFTSMGNTCWQLIRNRSRVIDVRRNCIPGLKKQRPAAECSRFMMLPKHCPASKYIPCRLPQRQLAEKPSLATTWPKLPAAARPTLASPPSRYVTYSMLHQPPRQPN